MQAKNTIKTAKKVCTHNIQVGKKDESNTTIKTDDSEFNKSFITGIDIKTT